MASGSRREQLSRRAMRTFRSRLHCGPDFSRIDRTRPRPPWPIAWASLAIRI